MYMHEMSYAVKIADIVLRTAEQEKLRSVKKVRVKCGETLAIVPGLLENAFSGCVKGTKAEGAGLEIKVLPVTVRCTACGKLIDPHGPEGYVSSCPVCGSMMLKMESGREFVVSGIEGET